MIELPQAYPLTIRGVFASLKTRKFLIMFLSIVFAEIALYNLFLIKHYTSDCYNILFHPDNIVWAYSTSGRPLTALLVLIIQKLHVNLVADQIPFTFAAILIISFSVYTVSYIAFHVSREKHLSNFQALLIIISSALVVNNVFTLELFTFSFATFFHALSIFFMSASLISVIGDITPRKYLLLLIFTILITFNYQGFGGIFVPLQIAFHLCSRKHYPLSRASIGLAKILSTYFLSLLCSMLYAKFIHPFFFGSPPRIPAINPSDIVNNIKFIFSPEQLRAIWILSYKMMPKYSLLFYFVSASTAFLFLGKKAHKDWKSTTGILLAIISSCLFITYVPHLLADKIWLVGRSTMGIGALPAILFLVCFMSYRLEEGFNIRISSLESESRRKPLEFNIPKRILITSIIVSFAVVTAVYVLRISWDCLYTNRQDRHYAKQLYRAIKQKEAESGVKVDKIAWTYDTSATWCYPDVICYGNLNLSARADSWGFPNLLRKHSGRDLTIVEMPEDVKTEYFAEKNWDTFDAEQVFVKGDTVYIAIY